MGALRPRGARRGRTGKTPFAWKKMQKAAQRIVEKLRLNRHEAFFAGGWVRDFLLGRKPKDIDIVTSAAPEEVQRLFPGSAAVGAAFGVILVRFYGRTFEVTTFRSEGAYLDGRHPSSVSLAGPREDALRRDFTINGLFYDPITKRVIDYVQGRVDVKKRIVRTIGPPEARFAEDKLRMMRAVRIACNLDFSVWPDTQAAIQRHAGQILEVSWERIRDELLGILTSQGCGRGLELLRETGLLRHILPEVEAMHGVPQPHQFHPEGDVFTHTRRALELLRRRSPPLVLGTLLHDVGKPPTYSVGDRIRFDGHVETGARLSDQICRRLRLSNEVTSRVVDLVENHLRFMHVAEMRRSTLRRFLAKPHFADHLELHRVDCLSSHRNLESYWFCKRELERMRAEPPLPPRLINGQDLIDLGYQPGPLFAAILHAVEDQQLDGILKTRDDALEFVRSHYPSGLAGPGEERKGHEPV
jgi:poly(A) polymerase